MLPALKIDGRSVGHEQGVNSGITTAALRSRPINRATLLSIAAQRTMIIGRRGRRCNRYRRATPLWLWFSLIQPLRWWGYSRELHGPMLDTERTIIALPGLRVGRCGERPLVGNIPAVMRAARVLASIGRG